MATYRHSFHLSVLALAAMPASALADAAWISHPDIAHTARQSDSVSLQFRREIRLDRQPARLEIDVSADNRFILFVNGSEVARGPARGDLAHWRFRRIDIARYLKAGDNVVAAQVWNDGKAAGVAQISARTGFWLRPATEGQSGPGDMLATGPAWQVRTDGSRRVTPAQPGLAAKLGWDKYFAAPPPETIDAGKALAGWQTGAGDDGQGWRSAVSALASGETAPWTLVQDKLPPMRMVALDGGRAVRVSGLAAKGFPAKPITVPPHSDVTIRLDMGAMRVAFPRLVTSGGNGARVELTYGEAPYGEKLNYLPQRDDGQHGWIIGPTDIFLPDGGAKRSFSPFWWRAWRFAELKVRTGAEPLKLESFSRTGTGYPFDTAARFASDDQDLNRIWQIGWDTVQLDAQETFMDTAYWEQLQYVGDTRIQALVSYAVSGDNRLARQAVEAFAASRDRNGLIQSRWPANIDQSIPPFALLWVGMLHDYWMYQPDASPVRDVLPEMRSSLAWYSRYVGADGLVGTTPGWEFIDWRDGISNFPETRNPADTERCIVSLMYLGALKQAADLETALGNPDAGARDARLAGTTAQAVSNQCWSPEKRLFADQPAKTTFSQHANILAVLYDVAPRSEQKELLERVLQTGSWPDAPGGITPATFYFDFYLARALEHADLGGSYLHILAPWRRMLKQGFTTWPESPDPGRSDSHAWSAHPTFDLLTIVAGITPAAPGFAKVRIAPELGSLRTLDAAFAHPRGSITVRYRRVGANGLTADIDLPAGLEGSFVWDGSSRPLVGGRNRLRLNVPGK